MRSLYALGVAFAAALATVSTPATSATVFAEEFADNSAGWTLGLEWQIGSAAASTGQSMGNPDPGVDHTPNANNGVAGVVIGGNASIFNGLHPYYYLESPVINLSNSVGNVTLQYHRWLNSDYASYMINVIDVFDGASWVNIWKTGGFPGVTDNAWLLQTFDITLYANNNFKVRYGFGIFSVGVLRVSSWNVDDVAIFDQSVSNVPVPAALPLFAGGLGLLGLLIRRRKRIPTPT